MKTFVEFLKESYLKGGRHLLYHYTKSYNIDNLFSSDTLIPRKVVDGEVATCFTRVSYFKEHSTSVRLVLDSDELKRHNFKTTPYDEVIGGLKRSFSNNRIPKGLVGDYSKVNPYYDGRTTIHNTKLEQEPDGLEWEYEERSYKEIPKLGRFIVSIDVTEQALSDNKDILAKYLIKYPHIEITLMDMEKLYDRRNIIDFNKYYEDTKEDIKKSVKLYTL